MPINDTVTLPEHIISTIITIVEPYAKVTKSDITKLVSEDQSEKPLLKIKDTAKFLGLSRVHISRLAEKGELKRINVGIGKNLYRITPDSVQEFIERRAGK
jgi:excisionase family DNA binding protein